MRYKTNLSQASIRAVYFLGVVLYVSLCAVLLISDALLGKPDLNPQRKLFALLSDWLLLPFPNNLFPLAFGITSSWVVALVFVGIANYLFFWWAGSFLKERSSKKSLIYAGVGYLALSVGVYAMANYAFFSLYFMQGHKQ